MATKPKATEERLLALRETAAAAYQASPTKHPQIQGHTSYYGLPALKAPVWTWEVPLYFFIGGISGVSACLAFVAQLFHADSGLIRLLLWMGLVGAGVCPTLLIADLGRPARFLYMLRVFKLQSTMSVGAWILVAFSGCAFLGVAGNELVLRGIMLPAAIWIRWIGEASGTVTGLLLASYTAVLIGATAIPVWNQNRRFLPAHFLTSGLGGSAAILELAGFLLPVTNFLGFAASGLETLYDIFFVIRRSKVDGPLHHGKVGLLFRTSSLLEGPAALVLRLFWGSVPNGRYAAAICFLAGSLLSRYAWLQAGHGSAGRPDLEFELQRDGHAKP